MKRWTARFLVLVMSLSAGLTKANAQATAAKRPHICLPSRTTGAIGHASAYGCQWTKTPAFDRVAAKGSSSRTLTRPTPSAPSRACLLTGRNSWQLEAACNHICFFPPKFKPWSEALAEHGYFVGKTTKGWAPGVANDDAGKPRLMAGRTFDAQKSQPPASGMLNSDYAENFAEFLKAAPASTPWCFWYGGVEPHRAYQYGSGVKSGKRLTDIDRVPGYWPDNETIRNDLLDYALEIEHFDSHLARMLDQIRERGEMENTLVIVTSDHGMPFPRAKGNAYDASNRVPLAIRWGSQIKAPGRTIDDYVSFIDIAPTLIEAAGLTWSETGMPPATGKSLSPVFAAADDRRVDPARDHVLIGQERHDIGRPNDWGYPIRGIVKDGLLYLRNFEPTRWPACNPETGYLNCDGSPTKTHILAHRTDAEQKRFWQLCFGKRPAEELYDVKRDPDCLKNLAEDPAHQEKKRQLQDQMVAALKAQEDPRMFGRGEVFEQYPYADAGLRDFYNRYMGGEKLRAGWVNPTDFAPHPLPD